VQPGPAAAYDFGSQQVTDFSRLTDDELARRAYVEMDPLYTTDLERELLTRFEKLAGAQESLDSLTDSFNTVDLADDDSIERAARVLERFGDRTADDAEALDDLHERGFTPELLRQVFKAMRDQDIEADDLPRILSQTGRLDDMRIHVNALHALFSVKE
jgi:hypothetical protein